MSRKENSAAALICPQCRAEVKEVKNVDPNEKVRHYSNKDKEMYSWYLKKQQKNKKVGEQLDCTQMHEGAEEHDNTNEECNISENHPMNMVDTNALRSSVNDRTGERPEECNGVTGRLRIIFESADSQLIADAPSPNRRHSEQIPSSPLDENQPAPVRVVRGGVRGSVINHPRSLVVKSFKEARSLNI